jgi:hypothetical protein
MNNLTPAYLENDHLWSFCNKGGPQRGKNSPKLTNKEDSKHINRSVPHTSEDFS